jgi:phosphatidylserine/phosphatidylglycerophosphate/cardiolipin synthase-like enzyme
MRFLSGPSPAGEVFAVTGVNTVSFGIAASPASKDGLLGFGVERVDLTTGLVHVMDGFKVFASVIPHPTPGEKVSTFDHPVQSFVWDDFTAEEDQQYTYRFHPVKGQPGNLDRTAAPLTITIRTEPLYTAGPHDVFFNRGVASSQYYTEEFGTAPIATLDPAKQSAALAWLTRHLQEALLRFIDDTPAGDQLLGCFYEFHHPPVLTAFRNAIDRGVDVRLIVDAKVNEYTDKDGVHHESFPRNANKAAIAQAGIPDGPGGNVIYRQARASDIAHNKFIVRRVGGTQATEVWSGSTNVSLGGISGQTNVGHWIRDPATAASFAQYWQLLSDDPGGAAADSTAQKKQKNAAFESAVQALSDVPTDLSTAPPGVTPIFSPRPDATALTSYAALLDSAHHHGAITLAFGISKPIKDALADNTAASPLVFMLLEKQDAPGKGATAFVRLRAANNVYEAWGSYLHDPVYQWAKETNAGALGLNEHVMYIHCKFMLVDPLGADPVIVTGSANFSTASITDNDENMVIVRGNQRAADIYFTEFNRLFNHYYFRSITEDLRRHHHTNDASLFLIEGAGWQDKYAPGTFKSKRLGLYTTMSGTQTL